MTTPVSNNRPVAAPKPAAPAANAPAANAPAKPAAPAGDTLALSASAKATAPKKTVEIDGKQYELRETSRKWKTWEKVTTFGLTGVGGVLSLFASVALAAPMSPTGAMSGAIWAVIIGGTAIGTGISYGGSRLLSNILRGIGGLFDGK